MGVKQKLSVKQALIKAYTVLLCKFQFMICAKYLHVYIYTNSQILTPKHKTINMNLILCRIKAQDHKHEPYTVLHQSTRP